MDFNEQFKHPPINTGEWFITILITNIPLIGFIMLVVWAFDKQGNPNKANWAKAKLIWYAAGIGIAILVLMLVGFGSITGIFDNIPWDDF
jgi:hypothetical protein